MILPHLPIPPDVTHDQRMELGQWVDARYRRGFQVQLDDGSTRDATQFELNCASDYRKQEAWKVRDQKGCCGQHSCIEGHCEGCGGLCPRANEVQVAIAFCNAFLKWIADANALVNQLSEQDIAT